MGINVLSLFDGMSCGRLALQKAQIEIDNYFCSEIKRHANHLVKERFPDTIQLGDIRKINYTIDGTFELQRELESWLTIPGTYMIDLLIGGSPCKGISRANRNQEGLAHKESILFWEYIRLYKQIKKYNPNILFLLENTMGQKEAINIITKELGVRPIKLNSSLVSAQNRPRLYWTNIPVTSIPMDLKKTSLPIIERPFNNKDILINDGRLKWLNSQSGSKSVERGFTKINPYPKFGCITASGNKKWNCNYIRNNEGQYRILSIDELEELQTVPKGYLNGLSYNEAYDLLGDGWTIDIIAHIFKKIIK